MILVAVFAVLLIALLYVSFHFGILMSGSREVRNAVDAAVLNVSKRVSEVRVPAQSPYKDVADTSGSIGLSNINRLWGKAYLINANAEAMQKEGLGTPYSEQNSQMAYQIAQMVNDQLYGSIVAKGTLDGFFNQLAASKPAKLLGAGGTVKTSPDLNWSFAQVDRGLESNIKFDKSQLPMGATLQQIEKGSGTYIQGYAPTTANNRTFCFTTFRSGEMPHLISDQYFNSNKGAVSAGLNVIPNAFQVTGVADSQRASLSAGASAVANPRRQFNLAMPHSFVTIQFNNLCKWYVEGKKVKETNYKFSPETQWEIKDYKLPNGGKLNGYASLGNEYSEANNLWKAMHALPGDHMPALSRLLQRIRQIKPGFSLGQLQALLEKQSLNGEDSSSKYFIYPVYNTPDLTDPEMQIASNSGGGTPSWLNPDNPPDGSKGVAAVEEKQKDEPNYNWQNIVGGPSPNGKHWTEVSGTMKWKPGTGYSQCLGELEVARRTEAYFTGTP